MNTYYCTHCGKKNAIIGDETPAPIPEPVHQHAWFKCAVVDGMEIHDCGCGERKRIPLGIGESAVQFDRDVLEAGSVNRALIYKE